MREFLGVQKFRTEREIDERVKQPGVAVGLVWTPVGGDIVFIEASRMRGGKQFTTTGHLGEVMQESMTAALTWVRSNAEKYGIDPDFFRKQDIHIHVPSGAVPKDGPSAGAAMVTSLVSLLTNRPIRNRLAMTGEMTLSGVVLPVGGIKEKVLGAKRAGVKEVLLPADNEPNAKADLPPELLGDLKITLRAHAGRSVAERSGKRPHRAASGPFGGTEVKTGGCDRFTASGALKQISVAGNGIEKSGTRQTRVPFSLPVKGALLQPRFDRSISIEWN